MESISWMSVLFYCLFSTFVYYQQLHFRHFGGSSQIFEALLGFSMLVGMITGLVYLAFYGWYVIWWAPILILFIGILATIPGVIVEKVVGAFTLSILSFIGWPVSAFFMFHYAPF